ncbi:MAG: hypothetical protein J6A51_04420, partial [Clostridia bacterium]|nr:hypothetical protein [Clostridia bacterium]
ISDKKYGIEQTCFEDATWDNTEPQFGEIPKYAHFAMDNNCHERPVNDKYDYNYPSLIEFSPKNVKNVYDYNPYRTYNKSENPISQLQIEKAYFNVLTKSKPNLTFEDLYSYLSQMAKQSYDEQLSRRFKGNLVQEKPLLTKQMAKQIFDQNRQNSHDCDLLETSSSQEL